MEYENMIETTRPEWAGADIWNGFQWTSGKVSGLFGERNADDEAVPTQCVCGKRELADGAIMAVTAGENVNNGTRYGFEACLRIVEEGGRELDFGWFVLPEQLAGNVEVLAAERGGFAQ